MTNPILAAADAFLDGGGGTRWAKFPVPGTMVGGIITQDPGAMEQATEFLTREPKFWKDGSPIMQLRILVQTQLREDADDDGIRAIIVTPGPIRDAVSDAVKASGGKLRKGGNLVVQYTHDGPVKQAGMHAPKQYKAAYTAPSDAFLAQPAAVAQPVQYAQPAQPATVYQAPPMAPPVQQQLFTPPPLTVPQQVVTAQQPQANYQTFGQPGGITPAPAPQAAAPRTLSPEVQAAINNLGLDAVAIAALQTSLGAQAI